MARLQLSKSSLARERKNLMAFERFLPSLDLKRQQLMAERAKAARSLVATRAEIEALEKNVGRGLRMLADRDVDLTDLARVTDVRLGTENIVGTRLPVVEEVDVEIRSYALMGRPHWVDAVAARLTEMLKLRIAVQVDERRLALLEAAVKTITQRVNLFDKVLIPKTRQNIKRVQIYLSDAEKAAVVRSKIAKRKRATATTA
ncbi:MAG: V-type ATP synthase subunit D [Hyphomicrobiales bacterium]|nr:V-type ATP synthase subunit D [Hyphomicrobiales bacterium]